MAEEVRIDEMNERLKAVSQGLYGDAAVLRVVEPGKIRLLRRNARFMKHPTFAQLRKNIAEDGILSSVPLCHELGAGPESELECLSGNHRVKAAKDAGLTEIMLLYTDQEMSHAQQVAIQLAHNAIAGQDDLAILRELYDEINDVALKEYSGLDDVILGKLNPPELDPLSEKGLEYRIVSIAFLPEEVEWAEKLFAKVLE